MCKGMYQRRMSRIILLCVAIIVTMSLMMVPQIAQADSPPSDSSVVYPTKTPPSEPPKGDSETQASGAQLTVCDECQGTRASSYMFYQAYDPYKSGTKAKGKAYTGTNYIPLVFKNVSAKAWLWKWVGDEWVQVAYDSQGCACPPKCELYAIATYSNAQSAYYITTSRHEVWADGQPLHYATDESDYVWLSF